ncbi:hypothetical protein K443DRAFT_9336 [Laccaria amethystina LaAM-08-1]|uniref:DUF4246 domain-containing protein n=1 Tax=Laccaria amethystina LaAM-08-1 TaxID=1095629 RepID=A0A0C9X9U8_9AGAR|nr:hypothetical protein K443DRAFT_9336 [Laccaria amethystina LaAM-08-1]
MRFVNPKEIFRDYARKIHAKAVTADPNFLWISVACEKVFDSTITEKWKEEGLAQNEPVDDLDEEESGADVNEEDPAPDDDVVKSDSAIPPDLQAALKAAVDTLEDVPHGLKDWHPGSDDLVLDLGHPSLFPLVYGRSKVLKEGTTTLDDCIERCGERGHCLFDQMIPR